MTPETAIDPKTATFRVLHPEEYDKLIPIFLAQNWRLPSPETSIAVVGELAGEIVLVHILQSILHAEPLWIREDVRGEIDWLTPAKMLEREVSEMSPYTGLVIVTENKKSEEIAKRMGFVEKLGKVFVRDLLKDEEDE